MNPTGRGCGYLRFSSAGAAEEAIDALNDDISWNPTWYIAAHDHAAGWSLEAAIPWDQISPSIPNPGQAWSLGIERIIPGRDLQRWVPADGIPNSQGHGLIIFE